MADISMCHGVPIYIEKGRFKEVPNARPCPLRDMCYRYTAPHNPHRQSFQFYGPFDGTCPHFYRYYKVTDKHLTEKMLANITALLQAIEDNDNSQVQCALLTIGTLANELKLSPTLIENYSARIALILGAHEGCVKDAITPKEEVSE